MLSLFKSSHKFVPVDIPDLFRYGSDDTEEDEYDDDRQNDLQRGNADGRDGAFSSGLRNRQALPAADFFIVAAVSDSQHGENDGRDTGKQERHHQRDDTKQPAVARGLFSGIELR